MYHDGGIPTFPKLFSFFNSWTGHGISGFVEDGVSLLTEIAVPYFLSYQAFSFFGFLITKK